MARPPDGPLISWNAIRSNVLNLIRAYFAANGVGGANQEQVDDWVADLIQNGTGITWTYNDALGTLTGNVTITQYTDENAQDAVGNILTNSSTITFTYNDGVPSITAIVADNSISNAKLVDMSPGRVKARRNAIGTGDPEDLTLSQFDQLLDDDPATLYFRLAGRATGQAAYGGTGGNENLILRSTSNAVKGNIQLEQAAVIDFNASNSITGFSNDFIEFISTEDFRISSVSGAVEISAGGGDISLSSTGDLLLLSSWYVDGTSGHLLAASDNSSDIGASGANRPRRIYIGTELLSPSITVPDIYGNTSSGTALVLHSTSHATKGGIQLAPDDWLKLPEMTAPGTPPNSFVAEYAKSSGRLFFKDDTGYEQELGHIPRDHIAGLLPVHAADTDHDITIAAGEAQDKGRTVLLTLASAITKQGDASWAVGTNAGGMDTGSITANAVYHWHLIRRPDTGVVDVLISLSLTAPTMPTNYTQRVYLFSTLTDASSNWRQGVWYNYGNSQILFEWNTPSVDVDAGSFGTSPSAPLLSVPTGLEVDVRVSLSLNHASAQRRIRLSQPGLTWSPSGTLRTATTGGGGVLQSLTWHGMTDTAGRVEIEADGGSTVVTINTIGWVQNRGASVSQG